ncbi:MAG: Rpn family recombination-promoting nuclease/putative transposase [Lachnospiraceae bacterium]|nr:Rpn family recombination-promoting nuclease/putative transposase [Lachnospiraceae bacterium]
MLLNSQIKDSGGKLIFDDNALCAQFLRNYVDIPCLAGVEPEDIEDVSEQFVPLFAEERNADRVKRIRLKGEEPFFLVSLIEHKTKIEYDVCMQLFRYMIYIWEAYAKEAEAKQRGITKQKAFRYPPVLPIIYYEGKQKWTVPPDFKSRIHHGEAFGEYVPDFRYYLVPICDYSNEELLEKADEMSLIMLINKIQTAEDVSEFRSIAPETLEEILKETPKHLLDKMANIMLAFLLKVNVPVPEAEELVERVREKKMAELFECMEKMDIQEERRKTAEQKKLTEAERRRTAEQKKRAEEAEARTEEQRKRAETAERLTEVAEKKVEQGIAIFIENCQEFSMPKEEVCYRLITKFKLTTEQANSKLEKYWR